MKPRPTAVKPPLKVQIADEIRMRIESGELAPGDSVPTIEALAEAWSTSPVTARAGLALLREQGLITAGRGTASKVRGQPRPALRSSDRHQIEKDLVLKSEEERACVGTSELETNRSIKLMEFSTNYETVPASEDLAAVFGIESGADILQRTYETVEPRSKNRQAWSVSYIPVALISSNPDLLDASKEPWPGGTQHQLYTVGIEIARITDEVRCLMPTTADRGVWAMDSGVPLIEVRRISVDTRDRVVEISDAVFPADRTKLVFHTPLKAWQPAR